ncbi:MAG TPA: hypothetical protein VFV78_01085 [Vicinamibacterales bacterium]|nr:hypothetical protein [Vicinamibacterales bacterium]
MPDFAPVDSAGTSALIVMAVAISIQTIVMIGALVAVVMAWRRLQAVVDARYEELKARVDQAVDPIRQAANAVEHVSVEASTAIHRAGHAAGFLKTLVTAPRTTVVYGAASLASALLKRWPRARAKATVMPAQQSRVVH